MAITCTMTGTGTIGDIAPGWSINKVSTPIIPGNRASGTGGASFVAKKNPDSLFVLNNESQITADGTTETGRITSVQDNGISVALTQGSQLAIYDTEETLPNLNVGNPSSAIDLISQAMKLGNRLAVDNGYFWSLNGHDAGFDKNGNMAEPQEFTTKYTWAESGSTTTTQDIVTCQNSIASSGYKYFLNDTEISYLPYAHYVRGETIISSVSQPNYAVAFKTMLNSGKAIFAVVGGPDSSITNTDREITVELDAVTTDLTLTVTYRAGGILVTDTIVSPTILDPGVAPDVYNKELTIFIEYNLTNGEAVQPDYVINVSAYREFFEVNTAISHTFTADAIPVYYNQWELKGDAYYRSLWVNKSGGNITFYESDITYNAVIASFFPNPTLPTQDFPGGPVRGGKYNVWQYLQDSYSAFGVDNRQTNAVDASFISDTRRLIDNKNYVASPIITPTSVLSAESVNIEYTNSSTPAQTPQLYVKDRPEVYSAYDDKNRIISVEPNEVIETSVKTDKYFQAVFAPSKSSIYINQPGYYAVCDSTGANVTDAAWKAYGGSVSVVINADDSSTLDIKVIGPTLEIPGKSSPYSIAYSSGQEKYAALSVTGSAVSTNKKSIEIRTGVVEANKKQKTAATITNQFISTLEQAYDRGVWVSQSVAGPNVSLDFSLQKGLGPSANVFNGRIKYSDSIYRINNCSITSTAISYNTEWCVALDDFDAEWSSHTVEFHDDLWGQYDIQDQIMAPFLGIEKVGVYLATDTDLIPTWTFDEFGEATLLFDDDGNPYFEVLGDVETNILLYLDSDFTPYYV